MRPLACILAASLAWLGLSPAPARAGDEHGAIAVLPFTSAEKRLEIYGVPVSRALTGELGAAAGARVQAVSDPTSLPRRIAWVIDGRIVERPGGKVALEARLRDPDRGSAAGQVTTRPRPLREIDRLARDLAAQLLPLLASAQRARAAAPARRAAVAPPGPHPAGAGAGAGTPGVPRSSDRAAPADGPPLLLVGHTSGAALAGLFADPIITARAADLAGRLGRRPRIGRLGGIAEPAAVTAALAGARAPYALLSELEKVEFSWRGVLTARGRIRIVLVDGRGDALYDDTIETDTVVGSRGDRHEALLGFVARQAMEIAAPRLRRILAR